MHAACLSSLGTVTRGYGDPAGPVTTLPRIASVPLRESATALDVLASHGCNHSITQFGEKVRERTFRKAMVNTLKSQN